MQQVEEMVLKMWRTWKNLELRTFKKVFRVPQGVVLDKIKAEFSEEDSTLTIAMPKLVIGIAGTAIEQVKEEELDSSALERGSTVTPQAKSSAELEGAEQVVETQPEIVPTAAAEPPEEEPRQYEAREDGMNKEQANEIGEVSDGNKGEFDRVVKVPEEQVERGGLMVEETSKETQRVEDQMEVEESRPEKVEEPPASIASETKEVQSERETQKPSTEMAAPVEEPRTEEIPKSKEKTPAAEIKAESELSVTGGEEQHTTPEKHQIESKELEKQEAIEEAIKPEPYQEVQGKNKEQVHEQEAHRVSNEIEESVKEMRSPDEEERNENVNPDTEKQIESNKGEIQKKKKKKKPKLCPPLVCAGSAILVSLIVFVISFIRSKKT